MRRSTLTSFGGALVLALAGVVSGTALAQSNRPNVDPSLGTWKLRVDAATTTAPNALKSRTEVVEAAPDGWYKITRTDLRADGTSLHYSFTFKYDGKEYPVTGALFDTIAVARLDPYTTTTEVKKKGTPFDMKGKLIISKDGKTRTQIESGIGLDGKPSEVTRIFDKQ